MSGPLTILHLTHEGHGAGSSISIALLARAQLGAGHKVLVGCPDGSYLAGLARRAGAALVPLDFRALGRRGAAARLLAALSESRADVVNAHSSLDRAACRRLRLTGRFQPALVMTRRGMPMSSPVSALFSGLAADRTIAVSRPVARALIVRGTPPWRVSVVHNAVDLERIDRPVSEAERRRVQGLLGASGPVVGVMARRKDHETLLAALRFVRSPITLCVVGFEPDARLLRFSSALAHRPSPITHHVIWLPFQQNVRAFYDLFDIVALPARYEGLSQGLLEAMALGRPVVATAAGGNTDLIADGVHGLLVPPRDPRALGAAIQRLLDDAALRSRVCASARLRVRSEFTIEHTAARTEAVYRAALARRGRNGAA